MTQVVRACLFQIGNVATLMACCGELSLMEGGYGSVMDTSTMHGATVVGEVAAGAPALDKEAGRGSAAPRGGPGVGAALLGRLLFRDLPARAAHRITMDA